jgi:hypothetical protein
MSIKYVGEHTIPSLFLHAAFHTLILNPVFTHFLGTDFAGFGRSLICLGKIIL